MYKHVFVAGTFDRLHAGHQAVFIKALEQGERVTIGITTELFLQKYKPHVFLSQYIPQAFTVRKQAVQAYVSSIDPHKQVQYVAIDDPFEPAASSPEYDAIIVTTDNSKTGETINEKRQAQSLPMLMLIDVPLVLASDGESLSSTRIRNGDIDTKGKLMLPVSLRDELKKPLGRLLVGDDIAQAMLSARNIPIITVGDQTTMVFRSFQLTPLLSVIDLKVERKPFVSLDQFHFSPETEIVHISSGPGFISEEAMHLIEEWGKSVKATPKVFLVDGEDDLLTLPLVICAPEQSVLYYGQPNQGMIEVKITEEVKKTAQYLLEQFDRQENN